MEFFRNMTSGDVVLILGAVGMFITTLGQSYVFVGRFRREATALKEAIAVVAVDVKAAKENIATVEKATNSMTTKLGELSDKAGHARGLEEARNAQLLDQAAVARGALEERGRAQTSVEAKAGGNGDQPVPVHDNKVEHAVQQLGEKQAKVGDAVGDLNRKVDEAAEEGKPKE